MTVSINHVQHPLIDDSLAVVRSKDSPNAAFRAHLSRIATIVLVEASHGLPTVPTPIDTPLAPTTARRLQRQPVVVPVLRAGLGFVPAAQELLPDADIGFVGMTRDEQTHVPESYVTKLPADLRQRHIIVVDPMLATGGSLVAALELIAGKQRESGQPGPLSVACVLAAPEGLARVESAGIDVDIFVAAIDDRLDDQAFIVPGLGDAGDRLFGLGG